MIRSDLHVHSQHSNDPTDWLMQRIGTQESYTTVEEVYTLAKNRGMNVVTITDHDTIEGAVKLVEHHPEDTFVSVEATTYFPENGCRIHVLVYDLKEAQFRQIQRIRPNIYDLRDYLKDEQLACSVAHATYSINGKLTFEILEKLILLFDVFEGINGSRNPRYNTIWRQALSHLTIDDIDRLYQKYRIEPFSETPWIKGFTGGTDDHAGLFIGQTYTVGNCQTVPEYIQALKAKQTVSEGRSGDFKMIAFAFYKVACDFSRNSPDRKSKGLLAFVNDVIFQHKRPGLKTRVAMGIMKRQRNEKKKIITRALDELIQDFRNNGQLSVDERIDKVYDTMAMMTDDFLTLIFDSLQYDLRKGDFSGIVSRFSAILPAMLLSAPFFSTLRYMSRERELCSKLKAKYLEHRARSEKRIVCFSDNVYKLDGIAATLRHFLWSASASTVPSISLALPSLPENKPRHTTFPFPIFYLPTIYEYTPEFYRGYTLRVTSLLKSLELIYEAHPDEILIATPGPVGLVGIIAGKLLGVPLRGIHHGETVEQAQPEENDVILNAPMEMYTRWVYSMLDEIFVPTPEHAYRLEERGFRSPRIRSLSGEREEEHVPLASLTESWCIS
jgi:hypothetical protein